MIYSINMLDLYDPQIALSKLYGIGAAFNLGTPKNTKLVTAYLEEFTSNLSEFPNLQLVKEKFNDVVTNVDSDLRALTLNDKITLLNMILIHYRLMSFHLSDLTSYPESTKEFKKELVKLAKYKRSLRYE